MEEFNMKWLIKKIRSIIRFIVDRFNYRFRRDKMPKKARKRVKKEKELGKKYTWYQNMCRYACGLGYPKISEMDW